MMLAVLKFGTNWDLMAATFKLTSSSFERLVTRFMDVIWEYMYEKFCLKNCKQYDMAVLIQDGTVFSAVPCAKYATDVIFQQANRPSGTMQEGKKYFSGKHKLYGYKTEVCVLPNGLAAAATFHYPGSTADVEIFRDNLDLHLQVSKKSAADNAIQDNGLMKDTYEDSWEILADKGYKGAESQARVITPNKKPINGQLSLRDLTYNNAHSGNRVIVENFFGRMTTCWGIIGSKWRWNEDAYDKVFSLCIALTNLHVSFNPLRNADSGEYNRYINRLYDISENTVQKRRRSQEDYRRRRRARISSLHSSD